MQGCLGIFQFKKRRMRKYQEKTRSNQDRKTEVLSLVCVLARGLEEELAFELVVSKELYHYTNKQPTEGEYRTTVLLRITTE